MLDVKDIVKALRCNRTEFGSLFYTAQMQAGIKAPHRRGFEPLTEMADDGQAFEEALNIAGANNFLEPFLVLVSNAHLEDGTLAGFVVKRNTDLQAMISVAAGFTNPLIYGQGILRSAQITGKVLLNGQPMGTGVLFGPNLFLTAWHVIREMFDMQVEAAGEMTYTKKAAPPFLEIEFNNLMDYVGGVLQPISSFKVVAHEDWLVNHSACNKAELDGTLLTPDFKAGFEDYAILRLKRPIGYERCWVTEDQVADPEPNQNIVLLQYPAGVPLKMDTSKIVEWLTPDSRLRFLHSLNALPGSSGGPCFNKEFRLVGLHQGAWTVNAGEEANRGIPISLILKDFRNKFPELPLPDPADCKIWCLDNKQYLPVIGCDSFQTVVWDSAINGTRKIISISGNDKSGKSFHLDVADAILANASHLKISLHGEDITKKTALQLVKDICSLAGVPEPQITPLADFNNTSAAWLNHEVAFKVVEALNGKRDNRTVWIMIRNLDHYSVEGEHASDFLYLLYEKVLQYSWLRLILDGAKTLPASLRDTIQAFRTHELSNEEIRVFLERFFTFINFPAGPATSKANAKFLYQSYMNDLMEANPKALVELADTSREFVSSYID